MKKEVMFCAFYKSQNNIGQLIHRKSYSIFTRKSKIVNDFFDWTNDELNTTKAKLKEDTVLTNLKIIGL